MVEGVIIDPVAVVRGEGEGFDLGSARVHEVDVVAVKILLPFKGEPIRGCGIDGHVDVAQRVGPGEGAVPDGGHGIRDGDGSQ